MLKMLARETLSPEEQGALAALVQHPGWRVVTKKLVPEINRQAQQAMIDVREEDPDFEKKVKAAQITARAISEVTQVLLRSIDVHSEAVRSRESDDDL
jgi:hypothetical protein